MQTLSGMILIVLYTYKEAFMKFKKFAAIFILMAMVFSMSTVAAAPAEVKIQVGFDEINQFLNEELDLGEGSKANPVAIIPIQHVDGPLDESDFAAFVKFKYVARDFVKYQVDYISCTCRQAADNYWSTVYLEMTLPESGLLDDAVIQTISYEKDPSDTYIVGFWGDSSPTPSGKTYEKIRDEYIPYFIGKTYGELKDMHFITDIDQDSYSEGEGREDLKVDAFSGATVSTNNIIRVINAAFKYHGTDEFFENDPSLVTEVEEVAEPEIKEEQKPATADVEMVETADKTTSHVTLPAPRNLEKTYKASAEATEESPCAEDCYLLDCSAIDSENLIDYLGLDDVLYIDLRNYEDYLVKHFRNFEVIPYFALIFDAEAHTNEEKIQLYGGTPEEPVPVYEESDKILEYLFPKDQTIFLICQSGGRVAMLMNILEARGWDMSKIYNIGGMAQYTGKEYRPLIVDTMEFGLIPAYSIEGLTRIAP